MSSEEFRAWVKEENTWFADQIANWSGTQYLHVPWDAGVHVPGMPPEESFLGAGPDEYMTVTLRLMEDGRNSEIRHRLFNRDIKSTETAGPEGNAHAPACLSDYYDGIFKTSWMENVFVPTAGT